MIHKLVTCTGVRRMQKISHTFLLNLKGIGEVQRIPVGDSLFLRVSPKGKKTWYLRYDTLSPEGTRKQNLITLGEFPALGLKEARAEADARKAQAKQENVNLTQLRKQERIRLAQPKVVHTFQSVADAWLDLKMMEWEERSGKQNRGRLVANVYPVIGDVPIDELTVNDIERALKHIIARGSLEVARRVHTLIVSIFKYALAKDLIQQPDIVVRLSWYKDQMPKRRRQSLYSEELGPEDVGKLLRSIDEHKNRWTVPVSMALQLAPSCAVRPSELLEAKWTEFNLDAAEWIIPSERMKVGRPHLVPLPRQAVELFKKMYAFSGQQELVFPSTSSKGKGKAVSSMALIQAFRKLGYTAENGNRFVTHAFRGLFSTTAYNILGASSLAVELQLAHVEQNKVKAAYHKTSLRTALAERRALLQQYADYLDELRDSAQSQKE